MEKKEGGQEEQEEISLSENELTILRNIKEDNVDRSGTVISGEEGGTKISTAILEAILNKGGHKDVVLLLRQALEDGTYDEDQYRASLVDKIKRSQNLDLDKVTKRNVDQGITGPLPGNLSHTSKLPSGEDIEKSAQTALRDWKESGIIKLREELKGKKDKKSEQKE